MTFVLNQLFIIYSLNLNLNLNSIKYNLMLSTWSHVMHILVFSLHYLLLLKYFKCNTKYLFKCFS